ncbi:MAG: hypothetical protein EXR79_15610 [Myxococcales bacterium]|nr:hypothetical protein [Myxococcales bacterium]
MDKLDVAMDKRSAGPDPRANVSACLVAWLVGIATACGTGPVATPDVAPDVADVHDALAETGPDVLDAAVTVQRWAVYTVGAGENLRAVAPVAGKPGSYLVVGDGARAWLFAQNQFTDASPAGIGKSNLRAVWTAPSGTVYVVGEGSALLHRDDKGWEARGEVPPTPAVTFLGVGGVDDKDVWAVGSASAAWHFDGSVWAPQVVSPTAVEGGGTFPGLVDFTCVAAGSKGDVWIGAVAQTGTGAYVLHGDGKQWKAWPVDARPAQLWVMAAGVGAPKVFAVGGSTEHWVAVSDGGAFVRFNDVKWGQRFLSVAGTAATVWAGASKGQLRKWSAGAWAVELVKEPPGTPEKFTPSEDLIGLAVHDADERLVLTATKAYRWGKQAP